MKCVKGLLLGLFSLIGLVHSDVLYNEGKVPFDQQVKLKVQEKATFSIDIPKDDLNYGTDSTSVALRTKLDIGKKVNLVVLYGSQSESWILTQDSQGEYTEITLCHDFMEEFDTFHILIHSYEDKETENSISFMAERKNISLSLEESRTTLVAMNQPATFMIYHTTREDKDRKDRFVLNIETIDTDEFPQSDKICMVIAVYNKECPLHNRPTNVKTAEMWTTALESATLTIRADKFCFSDNFYVSVVILPEDTDCTVHTNYGDECNISSPIKSFTMPNGTIIRRQKQIRISIDKAMDLQRYGVPIILAIISMTMIVAVSFAMIWFKTYGLVSERAMEIVDQAEAAKDKEIKEEAAAESSIMIDETDGVLEDDEAAKGLTDKFKKSIEHRESSRRRRLNKGFNRLKDNATLADNTKILQDVWFRRNRSRVYIYLVPLISIFYFVPAIQFAFQAKENEEMTGSKDLCFHNYKCARPWYIFSDFNHIISNMAYILFGASFMVLAFLKSKRLPDTHHPKRDHDAATGLLQQLSIFYAMGFSLMAQGFFSVCYHVCPTNLSLQFDTTMMYIICTLCYVKLYQFRHPDATANAYSTFGLLGILVLLEALALYSISWLVYGLFLVSYVSMTIFVAFDCYYIGVGRMDYKLAFTLAKDIFGNWRPVRIQKPTEPGDETDGDRFAKFKTDRIRYPKRFLFAVIFCVINFGYATKVVLDKIKDPKRNVTHVVLNILAGNLIMYLIYYIIRKNCCKTTEAQFVEQDRYTIDCGKFKIHYTISAGSFFAIMALTFGIVAINFYTMRSANRNLTPAESRNLNSNCTLLDFYDNHDLWHFFSAAGIFMAFMALLTVDDDLLHVPRDKIDVF